MKYYISSAGLGYREGEYVLQMNNGKFLKCGYSHKDCDYYQIEVDDFAGQEHYLKLITKEEFSSGSLISDRVLTIMELL